MIVKYLKNRFLIFVLMVSSIAFSISGCSVKQSEPEIVIVREPKDVYIPVKCNIPEPVCNNKLESDSEIITEMRLCINRYKEVYKSCNGSINNYNKIINESEIK